MRRVSTLLLGVLALSATAASAADMRPPPPPPAPVLNFAGWYVGASVGWAESRTSTSQSLFQPGCAGGGGGGPGCALQLASVNSIAPSLRGNSGIGTLQGGFNWRFGYLVAGVEGDISYWELSPSTVNSVTWVAGGTKTVTSTQSITADYIATLRGRIGFVPIESLLIYATGGWAVTDLLFSNAVTIFNAGPGGIALGANAAYTASSSQRTGSVIGGGFEYAWTREWTVRVDYQHLRFNNIPSVTAPNSIPIGGALQGSALTTTISRTDVDIIRVGVNRIF